MKLGDVKQQFGPYHTVEFMRFDNPMGAIVRATGQMPDVFPVSAVLRVTYQGVTTLVKPQFIRYKDNPNPKSPELKLPGGWLVGFAGMNAGSVDQANPGAGAMNEAASLTLREDSGPPAEAFELEVTTRPMINLVWVGTLLLVVGRPDLHAPPHSGEPPDPDSGFSLLRPPPSPQSWGSQGSVRAVSPSPTARGPWAVAAVQACARR